MSITLKVKDKEIVLDDHQIKAFNILKDLISGRSNHKKSFFQKIFGKSSAEYATKPQGLYLYGKVGRGKSMLMQDFFNKFPEQNKLYIHFNSFMQKIHRELYKTRQNQNLDKDKLIEIVTQNIIKNNKLLCLDEFQVDDVTDALILRRIFSYIFSQNVTVVFTSNKKPEDLYQNGLQRDLFLQFVNDILKIHCQIFNLDSETDYREKFLHKVKKHYFYPLNKENNQNIANILQHLGHGKPFYEDKLTILGRELVIPKTYENIAVFDFKELCVANLGVVDYQEICRKFHIIFLLNVPKLTKEERNEAKRLILFIDEIYENKSTLLMSSAVKIEEIYEEGQNSKIFKRTISRLKEIMSDSYGQLLH